MVRTEYEWQDLDLVHCWRRSWAEPERWVKVGRIRFRFPVVVRSVCNASIK